MLAFDADAPSSVSSEDKPLLHWLMVNIKATADGSLDLNATEFLPYGGPAPADNKTHSYYFLLLNQTTGRLNSNDHEQYIGNCSKFPSLSKRWV